MSNAAASTSSTTPSELFPVPLEPRTRRLESIDMLRGLLMILMALDHTRDFFSDFAVDPVDPHHSWPSLFFTRWITHLCAPGFVALAGASVYLQRRRGKSNTELQKLLITRGLWMMFIEVTVVSFGWAFAFEPVLQVFFAVGIAMVGLGLIIRLPYQLIAAIGIAIALLHNTLDPIHAASFGNYSDMWLLIHEQGILTIHNQPIAFVMYPALAWFGIICLGYSFGPIFTSAPELRQRIALRLSGVFAVVFCALRAFHLYGDHVQFEALQTPAQSAMSFMNVTKYPPSLDYMLATFSVVLAIYVVFDLASNRDWLAKARGVVETYGRVPFFYYVQHLYLLHITALLVGLVIGIRDPKPLNFSLGGVYLVWIAIVATLYWPCLWFSKLKARRRDWWLSYL